MNLEMKDFLIGRDTLMIENLTNGEQTVNGKSPLRPLKIVRMSDVVATAFPPPNTDKLAADEWRAIVTLGGSTRFTKDYVAIAFAPDVLGYARRGKNQTDYIQIVCPTTDGDVGSWYIHEKQAASLIHVQDRDAPDYFAAERIQHAWLAGWMDADLLEQELAEQASQK
jgi:hypothetical protein